MRLMIMTEAPDGIGLGAGSTKVNRFRCPARDNVNCSQRSFQQTRTNLWSGHPLPSSTARAVYPAAAGVVTLVISPLTFALNSTASGRTIESDPAPATR